MLRIAKITLKHMADWSTEYDRKSLSATEAIRRGIRSGDYLVFGHGAATPDSLVRALYEQRAHYTDLKSFHMLYLSEPYHLRPEMAPHLKAYSNFLDKYTRPAYLERRLEFIPCHFHEVPNLFRDGLYPVDVAMVQLSMPNDEGFCSFGISNDYTKTAASLAKTVLAEVNPQMPFIGGDNLIHISEIDFIVQVDRPLTAVPPAPVGATELQIGKYCAELIPDGATLQLGIGAIPDAVLQCLTDRKHLGIHTEMFTDGVMKLMQSGQIDGAHKTLHKDKVISTLIMGSHELYRFLDQHPDIEMHPVDYTNDPAIIGQNDRMVSINSCLAIDLTGQVVSESIGFNQFSGSGGQVDFLRGAKRSQGGVSILAFRSTAQGDTISRITPTFAAGENVTASRNDVDYIVTEYGRVRLRGLSLRQRAEALCSIAHPKFRPMLSEAIQERFAPLA